MTPDFPHMTGKEGVLDTKEKVEIARTSLERAVREDYEKFRMNRKKWEDALFTSKTILD